MDFLPIFLERVMSRMIVVLVLLAAMAGCSHTVQTSSGADYLARYAETAKAGERGAAPTRVDPLVRAAASVEPDLRLPGRFGLARIVNGRLTAVPEAEAALWSGLAERYGKLGEFVPISPLLAEFTARSVGDAKSPQDIVQTIRLGSARQHVDAVLVYEVGARSSREMTWLALSDLTLIGGAFLPTRSISAEGRAEALLLGVSNGYPYGAASVRTDLSSLSPTWGSAKRTDELRDSAVLEVVEKLVPEVEAVLRDLTIVLASRGG
jgi:hypothetical protein